MPSWNEKKNIAIFEVFVPDESKIYYKNHVYYGL